MSNIEYACSQGSRHNVSIWCAGSSEKVYAAVKTAPCPKCGKLVDLTRQGHIRPHLELKTTPPTAK